MMHSRSQNMPCRIRLRAVMAFIISLIACLTTAIADKPPNIMVIIVDDMGYSDLGSYGGEIETPHLDDLAENGIRFSSFYNTARCWPTRASLLTGYYPHQIRRDKIPGSSTSKLGSRPSWAPILPKALKPAGFRSYHSGKWHLDGMPVDQGFDKSYYLRDQGRFFSPQVHWKDDKKLPPVERGTGFYGTTAIADHAIECLLDHKKHFSDQPFFHYVAFTAPHFPLHAHQDDINKYRDIYSAGWDKIRLQRFKKLKMFPPFERVRLSEVEPDLGPPYHFPDALEILGPGEINRPAPWDSLTEEQKNFQAEKMAIHAAMVDRIDQETGRILNSLRKTGNFDNTLILFLSDNGASAEIMVRADGHDPDAPMGSAASYLCLGPGWSTACNTPFRKHKTWVHEGGCATPMIAHWPNGIDSKGVWNDNPLHVIDLFPTLISLTSTSTPQSPVARPGIDFSNLLFGNQITGIDDRLLWWSHEDNRAVRLGKWKLVRAGNNPWELFNMDNDRSESFNLAPISRNEVVSLESIWKSFRDQFETHTEAP